MSCLRKRHLFAICLSFLTMFTALAEDSFEGIEVFGKASVEVNDIPVLKIAVVEYGATAYKTSLLVKQKTTQMMDELLASGIHKQEIQISEIMINTQYSNQSVSIGSTEVLKRVNGLPLKVNTKAIHKKANTKHKPFIEASCFLFIELKETENFAAVYDAIIKYGPREISRIESSSDSGSFYSQALTQALDNARSKAQDLALMMNVSLGDIVSIQELGIPNVSREQFESNVEVSLSSHLKKKTVSAEVKVRFKVK